MIVDAKPVATVGNWELHSSLAGITAHSKGGDSATLSYDGFNAMGRVVPEAVVSRMFELWHEMQEDK